MMSPFSHMTVGFLCIHAGVVLFGLSGFRSKVRDVGDGLRRDGGLRLGVVTNGYGKG